MDINDEELIGKIGTSIQIFNDKYKCNWKLKPLPKKIEVNVEKIEDIMHTEYRTIDIIQDKYIADIKLEVDNLIAVGYNRCIDEILGEEDE